MLGTIVLASAVARGARAEASRDQLGSELVAARAQALDVEAAAPGARGELSLILLEAPERDLPLTLRVDAGPVALDDNRLDWSAVVDPLALQPRLSATFTAPAEPGDYEVRASVEYYVCSERWCRQKRGTLSWSLTVTDPP